MTTTLMKRPEPAQPASLATAPPGGDVALTAAQVQAQAFLVQEVMKAVMIKDVHYGTIPGCGDKPALLKAGSEKLLNTFRITIDPQVEDLSGPDVIRFRVRTHAYSASGQLLGIGIGECSSDEEKYRWRRAASNEEWELTPVDRRRIKRGRDYQAKQVRVFPPDVANTVLKIAKKRSQVDVTLTVTATSDIFEQDIDELAPDDGAPETPKTAAPPPPAAAKPAGRPAQAAAKPAAAAKPPARAQDRPPPPTSDEDDIGWGRPPAQPQPAAAAPVSGDPRTSPAEPTDALADWKEPRPAATGAIESAGADRAAAAGEIEDGYRMDPEEQILATTTEAELRKVKAHLARTLTEAERAPLRPVIAQQEQRLKGGQP